MDGRDFVHLPPPVLSGLPLEGGRNAVGGAAGRLTPSSGHLAQLSSAKYLPAALNLHSHPDGFYLPGHAGQSTLHTSMLRPSNNQEQHSQLLEKDLSSHSHKNSKEVAKDSKERTSRNEIQWASSKKDGRLREESQTHGVVDLTQDTKAEGERRKSGVQKVSKGGEYISTFNTDLVPNRGFSNGETKSKNPLQTSLLSNCNAGGDPLTKAQGFDQDRCARDSSRHDENMRPSGHMNLDLAKRCESLPTPGNMNLLCSCSSTHPPQSCGRVVASSTFPTQLSHSNVYTIFPAIKDSRREHKIIAPTFVPSVEAQDERIGPVQIASQARDLKAKEGKSTERTDLSRTFLPQEMSNTEPKRVDSTREKGSVIRSNSSSKRSVASDSFLNRPGLVSLENRDFMSSKEADNRERLQRSRETCKMYSFTDSTRHHTDNSQRKLPEQKWKPFEMNNFATTHMAALAAQHTQANHAEEEAKKVYMDSSNLQRSLSSCRTSSECLHSPAHGESSAMQNLIKYSGSFAKEAATWKSSGKKSPFGGLGNMKLDAAQLNAAKTQQCASLSGSKRDIERPESAKSFGRDSMGPQGEVEVRHPPVGIAVAVARQKDNGGNKISSSKGHVEEEIVEERVRHSDDRLLVGRLDREQEKLFRESKDLAEFARLHAAGCTTGGLNSNLMVTGGPAVTAAGRWPADAATAHLAAPPWIPRSVAPSMWLASHPYGLAHPSLHQGISPAFPPGMTASLPSAYHFARDPQSGQIMVIPTEQLAHFAELLDRMPALWPAMYGPTRSSLQHAHQLQLLSQQQLLRQHELFMLQQQAAHAMELQRNVQLDAMELQRSVQIDALELQRTVQLEAMELQRTSQLDAMEQQRSKHLVEKMKANGQQMEVEEKAAKQSQEANKQLATHARMQQRKALSPSVSASHTKECSPAFSPKHSLVTVLKTEVVHKEELIQEEPCSYSTTSNSPRTPSPSPAPPPATVIPSEVESSEDAEKEEVDVKKDVTTTFQEVSPDYPFQPLPHSFRQHYPFFIQPTTASEADRYAPAVPLIDGRPNDMETSLELKPTHLVISEGYDPVIPDTVGEPLENTLKTESDTLEDECEESKSDFNKELQANQDTTGSLVLQKNVAVRFVNGQDQDLLSCQATCISQISPEITKETSSTQTDFRNASTEDCEDGQMDRDFTSQDGPHSERTNDLDMFEDVDGEQECLMSKNPWSHVDVSYEQSTARSVNSKPEDPLAGMNALVAATEMPQSNLCLPGNDDFSTSELSEEPALFHGIALLSEMAELELEKRQNDISSLPPCPPRVSLESLLVASTQMLMEVLSTRPSLESLKAESIQLARELNPNKKYSWMQKKEETLFSMKSAIEHIDSTELDYRLKLAELQRQYKEKQREFVKLQRRKDSECEEKSRSLGRRGPGRPRKRSHGGRALSPLLEREKNDGQSKNLSKCPLLSEDSETGECVRRRLLNVLEDDEEECVSGKMKSRMQRWEELARSSSYKCEVQSKYRKKLKSSDQDILANKLDKALYLSKQEQFKLSDSSSGKPRSTGKIKTAESKPLHTLHLPFLLPKHGKSKLRKMSAMFKVKGEMKTAHTSLLSEVSSCSYNTDTEEDEQALGTESHLQSSSRSVQPIMYNFMSRKLKKIPECLLSPGSVTSSCGTVRCKQGNTRNKSFCSLLQNTEAGSSFSDSTEDSYDQDYSSEEEDYNPFELDHLRFRPMDESGLGLLARFAASVLPSPITLPPVSVLELDMKSKAKEERLSQIGE
uniref:Trinucleotide repeat-containing gene 18 protein n=1 Tax=Leptobrachium leishanense TaxID=445787 RepID=A0A8C5PWS8_9ANUR